MLRSLWRLIVPHRWRLWLMPRIYGVLEEWRRARRRARHRRKRKEALATSGAAKPARSAGTPPLAQALRHLRRIQIPERVVPRRPDGAMRSEITGTRVWSRPHDLLPRPLHRLHPEFAAPDGWRPAPDGPLETRLADSWDANYDSYQPFQPAKFWRNAVILAGIIEGDGAAKDIAAAKDTLDALMYRAQGYTVWDGDMAFLENRFDITRGNYRVQGPWVSALSNAFAILAYHRVGHLVPTQDLVLGHARAFQSVYAGDLPAPDRWISVRDRHGYLWFDEYPRRFLTTRVQNGHLFALFALHAVHVAHPSLGLGPLIQAGATTIEAYAPVFRCPGRVVRYAANWRSPPDYLPGRAVRQMFQLHEITGSDIALRYADLYAADMDAVMEDSYRRVAKKSRKMAVSARQSLKG